MRIRWPAAADADLTAILEYVRAERPAAANRILADIDRALRRVARFPESGRPVPETQGRGEEARQREVLIQPYRVGYVGAGDEIVVLYVIHMARQFPPLP